MELPLRKQIQTEGENCTQKIFIPFLNSRFCLLTTLFGRSDKKKNVTGGACGMNGDRRGAYRVLVGKPEGRKPLVRPRSK